MRQREMIRRGGTYGPPLPESTPEDGVERGIAAFVGTQDGSFDLTISRRPIRKKFVGLPSFTTINGGAYFFLPGIRALRFLAGVT